MRCYNKDKGVDMLLYHGTIAEFKTIDLSVDNDRNEFGKGFYLTRNYEEALDRAYYLSKPTDKHKVMVYETLPGFENLSYKGFGENMVNEEWLERVYTRNFLDENNQLYDIIEGILIDEAGKNTTAWRLYMQERIAKERQGLGVDQSTIESTIAQLKYERKHQMCLKTEKAINLIKLVGIDEV